MLLTADIGNTNIVLALLDHGDRVVSQRRIPSGEVLPPAAYEDAVRQALAGHDAPEGAVYTAVQVGPGEFLARVFRATDAGRPLDGTTRAQYVTIIYNAAGAPEVSGRPTFPDVEEDADYADALAVLDRITREDGSAVPCLRSVESAAGDPPFLV